MNKNIPTPSLSSSRKEREGFTLIELLVVIAVIGLLASIVLVSLGGSRDKARLAVAQQFASSVHHALGIDAVGIWKFEEGSGATTRDTSGYGNIGTLNNPAAMWQTESQCSLGLGKCLKFNGGDYITVPYNSTLKLSKFTMTAWIKTAGSLSLQRIVNKYAASSLDTMTSWINLNNKLHFRCLIASQQIGLDGNKVLSNNTWHFVTFVYDSSISKMAIYVDGALDVTRDAPGIINNSGNTDFTIGYTPEAGGTNFFNGLIDEVAIYSTALPTSQIQKLYTEGLPRHQLTKQ
jgi:large repetitive protein